MNQEKTTITTFQFRLNGLIIPLLKVRPVMRDGIVDHWELVASHDRLGEFAIDDNEQLVDPTLTRFVLEMRDANIPSIERKYLPNKGWRQVTTGECSRCSRRVDSPDQWDFVPEYVQPRLGSAVKVSHGLCPVCRAYFYRLN